MEVVSHILAFFMLQIFSKHLLQNWEKNPHIFPDQSREEVEREREMFFTSLLNKMRELVAAIFLCLLVCCSEGNCHSPLS